MEIFPLSFLLFSKYVTGYSEQCGVCICIRSIETIFCEGKHITKVESIPVFHRHYKTLILRDTYVLHLPKDICSWKVERIIIKKNIYFDCSSINFCENKLFDTDCELTSPLTFASTNFVTDSSYIVSSETITSDGTFQTNSVENSEKTKSEFFNNTKKFSSVVPTTTTQSFPEPSSSPSFTSHWQLVLCLGIVVGLLLLLTLSLGSYVFFMKKCGQRELSLNPALELEEISTGVVNISANIEV